MSNSCKNDPCLKTKYCKPTFIHVRESLAMFRRTMSSQILLAWNQSFKSLFLLKTDPKMLDHKKYLLRTILPLVNREIKSSQTKVGLQYIYL